jgi:hypothetical protein
MVMSISLSMSCLVNLLKKLEDFFSTLQTPMRGKPWILWLELCHWLGIVFARKCSLSWQTMLVHKTLVGVPKVNCWV